MSTTAIGSPADRGKEQSRRTRSELLADRIEEGAHLLAASLKAFPTPSGNYRCLTRTTVRSASSFTMWLPCTPLKFR